MNQEVDILFLKELFDIDDIKIERYEAHCYDVYMTGALVLWMKFDGETLEVAKPQNMNIRKKFVVNDKSISEIRKCIEGLWIDNYANLAQDD